nr:reverse transcriptase domain-containing protein [Tanacetum cinerariifolium]
MRLVGLIRHYNLDEETYPWFLHKNIEGGNGYFCFYPYPGSYQIAPDRADSELEASVEGLFDEGGSGTQTEQGDSARGGLDANIHPVVEAANTVVEDATLVEDHGTPSGASVGGKSRSTLQRLLAEAVLNAKVGVAAIPTLPFVIAYVSTTPKHEDGDHTDFVAEPNLCTNGASQRFIISLDSSYHSDLTIAEAEVDSLKLVKPFLFSADSSSAGGADPNTGVFSDLTDNDFLVGVFCVVRGMEHDKLFTEFNVGSARQISLRAEVRMRDEYNEEIGEYAKATRLRAQTSNLEAVEKSLQDEVNALKGHNRVLEKERNALDVKVIDLKALVVGKEHDLTDLNAQSLADVATYNPDAEADFNSAIQKFCEEDFPLLAELKSHKDASTKDIMNVLRLEGALADASGMNDIQPDIKQLKIRENIAAQWSALVGVWTPLSELLSATSLMGKARTSGLVPAASVTTTALSTSFASANSIPLISIDYYEIASVDGQEGAGTDGRAVADENVAPFPNVDDVELNIPRTEAVILVEISMPTLRTAEVDLVQNDEALRINLDLLEEKREQAAICEANSKAKMEKYYNSKV